MPEILLTPQRAEPSGGDFPNGALSLDEKNAPGGIFQRVDSRGSLLALRGENDIKNKRFMDQNNLQLKFPQNTETNTISALDPSFSKITKEFLYFCLLEKNSNTETLRFLIGFFSGSQRYWENLIFPQKRELGCKVCHGSDPPELSAGQRGLAR